MTTKVEPVGNRKRVNYWSWEAFNRAGTMVAYGIAGTRWGAERRAQRALRKYGKGQS